MKIGFIKDVFGSVPHVAAFDNEGTIEVKSITSFGERIVTDPRFDKLNIKKSLPDGFVFTGFFQKSDESSSFEQGKTENNIYQCFAGSRRIGSSVKGLKVLTLSISDFKDATNKLNAVAFKASKFKNLTKRGELSRRLDSQKTNIDLRSRKLFSNKKNLFSEIQEKQIRADFGDGFVRKSVQKLSIDTPLCRRTERRSKVLAEMASQSRVNRQSPLYLRIEKTREEVLHGR